MYKKAAKNLQRPLFAPKIVRHAGFSAPKKEDPNLDHYDVVIVGGYTGSYFARHLKHHFANKKVMLIDGRKSLHHTLAYHNVLLQNNEKERDIECVLNGLTGADIAKEPNYVEKFEPEKNRVVIEGSGREIGYDFLVLCPGLEYDIDSIKGLREAYENLDPLGHNVMVEGNFSPAKVGIMREHTFKFFQGNYVFWAPKLPYRGEGSSTSMIFPLFNETKNNRKLGRVPQDPYSKIFAVTADDKEFFRVPDTQDFFTKQAEEVNASVNYHTDLLEVNRAESYCKLQDSKTKKTYEVPFSSMYVIPPAVQNKAVKSSSFLNKSGFIDIDPHTLQHKKYNNVFAFGDAADLPTVKSFHAAWNQSFFVEQNLGRAMKGQTPNAHYDGWSIWPIHLKTHFTMYGCNTHGFNPTGWHHMGESNWWLQMQIVKKYHGKLYQVFSAKEKFGHKWFGKPYKNKWVHRIYDKYPELPADFVPPSFTVRTNGLPAPNPNDYDKYDDNMRRKYWQSTYDEIMSEKKEVAAEGTA